MINLTLLVLTVMQKKNFFQEITKSFKNSPIELEIFGKNLYITDQKIRLSTNMSMMEQSFRSQILF